MNRKVIISLSSLLLLVILVCIAPYQLLSLGPPSPSVKVGLSKIKTTEGSYCWNSFFNAKCVDKIYTSPYDMADTHSPKVVEPNEQIKIRFLENQLSPFRCSYF